MMKAKLVSTIVGLAISSAAAAQMPADGPIAALESRIAELERKLEVIDPPVPLGQLQIVDANGRVFGPVLSQTDSAISEVVIGENVWRLSVFSTGVQSFVSLDRYRLFLEVDCGGQRLVDVDAFGRRNGLETSQELWENHLPYEFVPNPSRQVFKVPSPGAIPRLVEARSLMRFGTCFNQTQFKEAYFEDDLMEVDPTEGFELPFSIPVQTR